MKFSSKFGSKSGSKSGFPCAVQSWRNGWRLTGSLVILISTNLAVPGFAQSAAQLVPLPSQPLHMAQASSLTGNWRLANMTAGNLPTPMLPVGELTLEFADGQVGGSGGCNRFRGGYETTNQSLSIGPLASTFKACEQSIMTQEMRYLQALQGAQSYEISDKGLTISYQTDEGAGVLRFVQAEAETGGAPESTPEGTQGTQEGVRGLW
ncbi:MAG: META domain-containing protein [Elainella sp.]